MIKIYPRISSIVGATLDRFDVRFPCRVDKDPVQREFIRHLIEKSGKSTNNPIKMIKNWKRAYDANLKKNMMISNLKDTMAKSSKLDKIV